MTGSELSIDWRVVSILIGLIAGWSLVIIATVRWVMGRTLSQYDRYFNEQSDKNHKIEKDILRLRAELPVEYVRKEDHIRFETVITAKLDALGCMIETLKDKRRGE